MSRWLSFLVVCQLQVHQRYVLVAVAGIGILLCAVGEGTVFRLYKLYGSLRTVLYAGKAELTVASHPHALTCLLFPLL